MRRTSSVDDVFFLTNKNVKANANANVNEDLKTLRRLKKAYGELPIFSTLMSQSLILEDIEKIKRCWSLFFEETSLLELCQYFHVDLFFELQRDIFSKINFLDENKVFFGRREARSNSDEGYLQVMNGEIKRLCTQEQFLQEFTTLAIEQFEQYCNESLLMSDIQDGRMRHRLFSTVRQDVERCFQRVYLEFQKKHLSSLPEHVDKALRQQAFVAFKNVVVNTPERERSSSMESAGSSAPIPIPTSASRWSYH